MSGMVQAQVCFADFASVFEDDETEPVANAPSQAEQRSPITTFMVRNIPKEYNQETLLEDWVPDGSFDFLYLPRNNGGNICLGYGFINFLSEEHASAFLAKWEGGAMPRYESEKRLQFYQADVQGFEACIEQYKRKLAIAKAKRTRLARPFVCRGGYPINRTTIR